MLAAGLVAAAMGLAGCVPVEEVEIPAKLRIFPFGDSRVIYEYAPAGDGVVPVREADGAQKRFSLTREGDCYRVGTAPGEDPVYLIFVELGDVYTLGAMAEECSADGIVRDAYWTFFIELPFPGVADKRSYFGYVRPRPEAYNAWIDKMSDKQKKKLAVRPLSPPSDGYAYTVNSVEGARKMSIDLYRLMILPSKDGIYSPIPASP